MKRTALTLTLALCFSFIGLAWSQVPAQRVIIVDPTGMHAASVTGGNLGTAGSASVTVDTISHITSALHVAGIAQTVAVDCVSGCSASAGTTSSVHVAVALHVGGTINGAQFHIQGLGIPGQAHGGVLTVQGIAGGVAQPISGSVTATIAGGSGHIAVTQATTSFKVQGDSGGTAVFVQGDTQLLAQKSTVPGISDVGLVTRSAGHTAVSFVGGGHIAITQAAAALQVDCSNCAAAATVAVTHVASVTHVVGTMKLASQAGTVVTVTGTALDVNCTGCAAASSVTVSHVQSVTHVALVAAFGQHVGAAQSGVWNVTAHQGGTWTVAASGHLAVSQADQWRIAHINSVTHVVGIGNGGALHVAGLSNVGSGTPSSGTTPMACHTTVAFSTTADLVLAHSQNSWRIYICAIVLVNASAESVSIVEGTGAACATSLRGIIGGFGGTMSLAANGGFSAISPFPVFSSSTNGNNVCLDKSGSGNVSGSISYRAAP